MSVYRRKIRDKKTGEIHLGSYYFKFDMNGETFKETVKTAGTEKKQLEQANKAELLARIAVCEGTYGQRSKKQLFSTFVKEIYLPHTEQHNKRPEHYEQHTRMLCAYFEGRHLSQISPLAIETFKRDRLKTPTRHNKVRSPRTVNCEMTTLSAIFTLAVSKRIIKEHPCTGVKWLDTEEIPIKRLSDEEEDALLQATESDYWWIHPMTQLAIWTGFRQGELIALAKGAIDFARNRLYVVNPKYKKDKRKTKGVPMGAEVRALLQKLCAEAKGELLFVDDKGQRLARHLVYDAFIRSCTRAGLKLRFHDLRHEYLSRLGDADVNLKKMALLAGHAKTTQTERYTHPDEDQLLAATEIAARGRSRIVPERLRAVNQ